MTTAQRVRLKAGAVVAALVALGALVATAPPARPTARCRSAAEPASSSTVTLLHPDRDRHRNTGELIGFTSAHCGGPGALVAAEGVQTTA